MLVVLADVEEALLATSDLQSFKATFDRAQKAWHDPDRLLALAAQEVEALGGAAAIAALRRDTECN